MPLIESKAFRKEGSFSRCVTQEEEKGKRKYSIDTCCHLALLFYSHLCVRLIVFYDVTLVNTSTICQDH